MATLVANAPALVAQRQVDALLALGDRNLEAVGALCRKMRSLVDERRMLVAEHDAIYARARTTAGSPKD